VDRIERADRLHRERPPSAGEHSTRHCNDVAPALEYLQRAERRALVGGRQASRGSGADDCSCAFREGQRGRDTPAADAKRFQRRTVTLQQSCHQSA
jgi:hypothetical protein